MPRRLPARAAGGSRTTSHLLRRAMTRGTATGARIAAHDAKARATRRTARKFVRRSRPEIVLRPDYIPLAVH